MTVDWTEADGTAWREEFKRLKGTLSLDEARLLDEGATTIKKAWQLGALHAEYKRLKRNQPPELPDLKE